MPEDASAPRVSRIVIQDHHGFTRGQVVRFDGTDWVLGSAGESGLGLVGSVIDSGKFEFIQLGFLDGLSDLTAGTYYVSATTAGELTQTVTSSPLFNAYTASTGFVITSSGGGVATGGSSGITREELQTAISTEVTRANTTYVFLSVVDETIDDRVDALIQVGTGIAKAYDDAANTLTLSHVVPWITVTADYTVTEADRTIFVDATIDDTAVTLPDVLTSTSLAVYTVKKVDSSANTVTIAVPDSATIDGETSQVLSYPYEAISVQHDGTNWYIIYRCPAPTLLL